jgi:hypothetical protein
MLLVLAIALLVGVAGCGASDTGQPSAGDQSPQAILAGAVLASQNITGASGSFDISVSFDADASQLPAEMKDLVSNPVEISGTFAGANKPEAADVTLSLQMAGQTLKAALKSVDDKAWLQFGGQWYEISADMLGAPSTSTPTTQLDLASITGLLAELGIDPTTWIKDLTVVGEESVDGADTYHLKGTPDVAKMLSDALQLMQSPDLAKLLDPSGTGTSGLGGLESMLPSPDELQQTENEITQMFNDLTVEAWVGKADSFPRKATLTASITPPPGQDAQGLNAVTINATVTLKDFNQPLSVQAPASSLPITDLEKAIQDNPELLGPLGGLLGGMMGGLGTTDTTATY